MWSLQDAKNKFSAVVDAALSGKPQEVSRRGRPAVVVISAGFCRPANSTIATTVAARRSSAGRDVGRALGMAAIKVSKLLLTYGIDTQVARNDTVVASQRLAMRRP